MGPNPLNQPPRLRVCCETIELRVSLIHVIKFPMSERFLSWGYISYCYCRYVRPQQARPLLVIQYRVWALNNS